MPFPTTRDALIAGGYKFEDHARCRGCKAEIEWWTTPKGKKMPINLMIDGKDPAVSHWSNCPNVADFRK